MPKTNKATVKESETLWGTWEELLLACAVNRYGAQSWESVAVEIQKRCSGPAIRRLLTPENCKQKYLDLERRYNSEENKANRTYAGDDDDRPEIETIPWLDELRNLRMAELKRELERYDISIVSLQKKVKRLKEERESNENGEEKSDLEKSEEKDELKRESEKLLPELKSGNSDRDNQSVNESNWTDPKGVNVETVTVKVESEAEPIRIGELKIEPDVPEAVKPVLEESCNGSSDSIIKEPALVSVKVERVAGVSETPEMESDGAAGEDGAKENSDVQSSASKLRKEGHDPVVRGSSIGDEPENEDNQSPARKVVVYAKSQPLIDILEIVRSHKLGSIFGSRLASQESVKYKNLIRQHVDLKTLQTRLDEGFYSDCTLRFYRDLLLLINNALIFFRKKSSEFLAATEFRQLVSKKISRINSAANSAHQEKVPPVQLPKKASDPCDSLLLKPKIAGPAMVCRKRSSIASKALAVIPLSDNKKEQTEALSEEKPINKSDQTQVAKKRTKDSSSSGSRNAKKTAKNESLDLKIEKKMTPNTGDVKKESVANFLNRMKRSSSSNNGSAIDSLSDGKGGQRSGSSKGEGKKKEEESPKRAAGRPPKRAATRPPPPQSSVSGKRSKEAGEAEAAAAAAKQPKKRSRK